MTEVTFRWIVAGGVSLAALSFLAAGIAAVIAISILNKVRARLEPALDRLEPLMEELDPITRDVRATLTTLRPRLMKLMEQATEVSELVVTEAHRYSELSKDVAARASAQVARLDGVMDSTVDQIQGATVAARSAVLKPIREVDGVISGLRVGIATLARGRRTSVSRATQDEEMFI